jgi:hypothetical protein
MKYITEYSHSDVINILSQNVGPTDYINMDRSKPFKGKIEGSFFAIKYNMPRVHVPTPWIDVTVEDCTTHALVDVNIRSKKQIVQNCVVASIFMLVLSLAFLIGNDWSGVIFAITLYGVLAIIQIGQTKHYAEKSLELLESLLEMKRKSNQGIDPTLTGAF